MNSQGRHFRLQIDPTNPICDYEGCLFFTSNAEFSDLPYPTDVSLGPVDGSETGGLDGPNSELSTILKMLQEQKNESEKQNSHSYYFNSRCLLLVRAETLHLS